MLVSWNTTRQCHLKCRHCYRDAGERDPRELDTEEGRALIDEIAAAGFKILILSGGEPLLRGDIFELTSYAAQRGLRPVFGTSGTTIDEAVARRLKEAGAQCIGISLDSPRPEVHDALRGVPGAWERAVAGMKHCAAVGLPFQVNTTVWEHNFSDFEEITDLSARLGARAHHVFFLVPTGRAREMEEEALTPAHYEELLHRILRKQGEVEIELKPTCAPQFMRVARQMNIPVRFTRGCLAALSYCCITPGGDVHPCPYLPITVGNVRHTPFGEIWRSAPLFEQMRTSPLRGKCGGCHYAAECGGCRARAYHQTGDIMGEDPLCLYEGGTSGG